MRNLKRQATRLTLAISVSLLAACATLSGCPAATATLKVPVYGFDFVRTQLYHGKKDAPTDAVSLTEQKLIEKEFIALKLKDWNHVRRVCSEALAGGAQ